MFNICSDDKIPFAKEAFEHAGNVTYCKGNRLTSSDLKGVDILLIRSGTRVDSTLLEGTNVKFVASATAGTDHVDFTYLNKAGIPFYNAPGCNAYSVVEYITAALFVLAERKSDKLVGKTMGIIGAGNVGSRLADRMAKLGLKILLNDPPRFDKVTSTTSSYQVVNLNTLLEAADIVSLHVPLSLGGEYPTFHLIGKNQLSLMKSDAWLLNASRGAVVSNDALKSAIKNDQVGAAVLDVWEGEPSIDYSLLEQLDLGTAHIAGYSYEGKVTGTIMIYDAFIKHFNLASEWNHDEILLPLPGDHLNLVYPQEKTAQATLTNLVKKMYDIEMDDSLLRAGFELKPEEHKNYFLKLRKEYRRRRSFDKHYLKLQNSLGQPLEQYVSSGLGIKLLG